MQVATGTANIVIGRTLKLESWNIPHNIAFDFNSIFVQSTL